MTASTTRDTRALTEEARRSLLQQIYQTILCDPGVATPSTRLQPEEKLHHPRVAGAERCVVCCLSPSCLLL